jgi:hypothetical protein
MKSFNIDFLLFCEKNYSKFWIIVKECREELIKEFFQVKPKIYLYLWCFTSFAMDLLAIFGNIIKLSILSPDWT